MEPLTARQQAEAIEQFGDDLAKLLRAFDRLCPQLSASAMELVNDIPHQDKLDGIAEAFRAAGDLLCRECDHVEAS